MHREQGLLEANIDFLLGDNERLSFPGGPGGSAVRRLVVLSRECGNDLSGLSMASSLPRKVAGAQRVTVS